MPYEVSADLAHRLASALGPLLDGLSSDVVLAVLEAFTSSCLDQISRESGENPDAILNSHTARMRALMNSLGRPPDVQN